MTGIQRAKLHDKSEAILQFGGPFRRQWWVIPALLLLSLAAAAAQSPVIEDEVNRLQGEIRATPRRADVWKSYGLALVRAGSHELAAGAFSTSCRLAPGEIDACYLAGRLLLSLDRYEEAASALDKALQGGASATSRPATAHRLAALNAIGLHDLERAESHFQRAVLLWRDAGKDGPDPRSDYGGLLYRSGRLAEAEKVLREAVRVTPESPGALALLGRVRIQLGAHAKALQPLRKAVSLAPCEWDYRLLLGKALLATGDVDEGTKQMQLGREGWASTAPGPGPGDSNAPAAGAEPCRWAK